MILFDQRYGGRTEFARFIKRVNTRLNPFIKKNCGFIAGIIPGIFLLFHTAVFSQTEVDHTAKKKSKFNTGLYLGSYFANPHTATLYDGYGYDVEGKKNNFFNSFMYQRVIIDYGGGNGQPDQVAQALGIDHGEWRFDQTDMPLRMKYNASFMLGVQLNYGITKKDALLLHVNASKITLSGNFTIVVTNPLIGPQQPGYENIKTFSITGGEQRMILQMGYRKILGGDDIFNFFIEGGGAFNLTKYLRNQAAINNLYIDLSSFYNQPYYPTYRAPYLNGMGLGAFGGFGLNLHANSTWSLQLLYSPSFEKINIGEEPKFTLQHAFGARAFYNL